MTDLSFKNKRDIEELFDMKAGYVLDFSNTTFARFVGEVVGIDIYEGKGYTEYTSKANKLRQIFSQEDNQTVGHLLSELLLYCRDLKLKVQRLTDYESQKIEELLVIADKLMGDDVGVELPETEEETLQTLVEDIKGSLSKNKPSLVLDRLHTFSTKFIRQICESYKIEISDPKGVNYPLHNLVGMLRKKYEETGLIKSEFSLIALRNSTSLFQHFNDIRNDHSYAHDNEVLGEIESEFIVKTMANVLIFLDKVERMNTKTKDLDEINIDSLF